MATHNKGENRCEFERTAKSKDLDHLKNDRKIVFSKLQPNRVQWRIFSARGPKGRAHLVLYLVYHQRTFGSNVLLSLQICFGESSWVSASLSESQWVSSGISVPKLTTVTIQTTDNRKLLNGRNLPKLFLGMFDPNFFISCQTL